MCKLYKLTTIILSGFVFCYCNQPVANIKIPIKRAKIKNIAYHLEKAKEWIAKNRADSGHGVILTVNRTDMEHLAQMDSIIVPNDVTGDIAGYLPFPINVPSIKDVSKIIFFSYPTQSFGAYEMGALVYTGPVNMGRKKDPTPTGLYYANWKAEKTTSTFNDEWDLLWNVNIENKLGIGWHQYNLPGYPASHSCLRLPEKDARYLYTWVDQWIEGDKDSSIKAQGTPAIVFGTYPFDAAKPWFQLLADPHALDITPETIHQQAAGFLNDIMRQEKEERKQLSVSKCNTLFDCKIPFKDDLE